MTDRDAFAAAALTGLLAAPTDKDRSWDYWARIAYEAADAMLARRDGVTERLPKKKRSEVSDDEPVAWAIERSGDGSMMGFCHTKRDATRFAHAIIDSTKSDSFTLRHVPLYRQPQPTLTDAELEAIAYAAQVLKIAPKYMYSRSDMDQRAETLRGVLRRIETIR